MKYLNRKIQKWINTIAPEDTQVVINKNCISFHPKAPYTTMKNTGEHNRLVHMIDGVKSFIWNLERNEK